MSNNSLNASYGTKVALQALKATNAALSTSQNRIATGQKVTSALDDSAAWSIAQSMRSQNIALDAVTSSLNRGVATLGVANTAASAVSEMLAQMQSTVLAASDQSLDAASRAALQGKYQSLGRQVQSYVKNASFNGANLLNGSMTSYTALSSLDGTSTISALAQNFNPPRAFSGGISAVDSVALATDAIAAPAFNVVTVSQDSVVNISLNDGTSTTSFPVELAAGGYTARDLRDAINSASAAAGLDPALFNAPARALSIRSGSVATVTFNTGTGDFAIADNVTATFGFTAGNTYNNRQTGAVVSTASGITGAGIRASSTVQLTTDAGSSFSVNLAPGYYSASTLASLINNAYTAAGNAGLAVTIGPGGGLQTSGIDTSGLAALTGTADLAAAGSVQTLLGDLVQTSAATAGSAFTETGGGGTILVSGTENFSSATNYSDLFSKIKQSITNVSTALGSLGTATNALTNHASFVSKLQDILVSGIGNLIDADVAKEAAILNALQTKQQLGVQALSIANSSSSVLLSLFHG